MDDEIEPRTFYGLVGVHGGVALVRHGDIFILLTVDLAAGVPLDDRLFARESPGRPAELTQEHLRDLRDLIDAALEE